MWVYFWYDMALQYSPYLKRVMPNSHTAVNELHRRDESLCRNISQAWVVTWDGCAEYLAGDVNVRCSRSPSLLGRRDNDITRHWHWHWHETENRAKDTTFIFEHVNSEKDKTKQHNSPPKEEPRKTKRTKRTNKKKPKAKGQKLQAKGQKPKAKKQKTKTKRLK